MLLSKKFFICAFLFSAPAFAGTLVEDFTTLTHADLQNSTGVWNVISHQAQSAAYANADATRPISFGNGADGAVDSANGYTFNTDSHPNGFNFTSVNITGGVITVTGSNALVIRSLGSVNILPTIPVHAGGSAKGADAVNGVGTATTAGTAVTCSASGGAGGTADGTAGNAGTDGNESDGTLEAGNAGAGQTGANNAAVDATFALSGPISNDFDAAGNFVCGSGGAGGGGYSQGGAGNFASGGAGGAGGGRMRITAIGDINVGTTEATGGNGGNGATVNPPGGVCSGNGAGGNGGAIWMQTLGNLTSPAPTVTAGTGGTSACFAGSGLGLDGFARGDSAPGSRSAWATVAGNFDTDQVPANTTSVVMSKAYDLGVWNAGFTTAPTITKTLNGGTITVAFAGSKDGNTFDGFVSDITELNNKNYRYIKFKLTITSGGVAAASPLVSKIALDYSDLGLDDVPLSLFAGCGAMKNVHEDGIPPGVAVEIGLILLVYLLRRRAYTARR